MSKIRPGLAGIIAVAFAACHSDAVVPERADLSAARDLATPRDLAAVPAHIDPGGQGGSVGMLSFTAFGDIRPPILDDDIQYPSTIAKSVFDGMAKLSPQLAVGTGDYMFVEFLASSANGQIAKLKAAQAGFTSPIFHAMGNHECNSLSDLNCPNLNESPNIGAFLAQLVPFTKVPWYSFTVHTSLGDAKLVFIAVNAWNDAQAAWLTATMQEETRYTFIVRHQPTPDAGDPSAAIGIAASDQIIAGHPVTLFLFGHVHEYLHLTTNAVIVGNAGAPLVKGDYGWLQVQQRADASVAVTAYAMTTGLPIDTWAVTPEGLSAP